MMISDKLGREFRVLRLSLTDSCNFACLYCAGLSPSEGHCGKVKLQPAIFQNPIDIVRRVQKINELTKLSCVRLTGGEPTLYKPLTRLIYLLKKGGISDIRMTTNGSRLCDMIDELKSAGLSSVNISLDAVNRDIFHKINRRSKPDRVLKGIEKTMEAGMDIKINCTIMRGVNESEIIPVLQYGAERHILVRFLELMKMGPLREEHEKYYYSEIEILQTIAQEYDFTLLKRTISSTARYWETTEGIKFGIIANHSVPFCSDCNRLRIDSGGRIYGCLSADNGFKFPDKDIELKNILQKAIEQKQMSRFTGSSISMLTMGG